MKMLLLLFFNSQCQCSLQLWPLVVSSSECGNVLNYITIPKQTSTTYWPPSTTVNMTLYGRHHHYCSSLSGIDGLSRFCYPIYAPWFSCSKRLVMYLAFQSFDNGHIWKKLFQKLVVGNKLDIYVFLTFLTENPVLNTHFICGVWEVKE